MRNAILVGLAACALLSSWPEAARAEEELNTIGFQADVGAPDGAGFSVSWRPGPITLTAGATYNLMAVGPRVGAQLDVIGPLTLSADLGISGENDLSLFTDEEVPSFNYNYANLQAGFATGGDSNFRFFMRGGISYIWFSVEDYQNTSEGTTVTLRDISGAAYVAPTLKLGVNWFIF